MSKGLSIKVQGLDKLNKRLGEIPKHIIVETDALMSATAEEFVNRAVIDSPTDQGVLRQGITYKRKGEMNFQVVSSASWSAYIEFGTKSRVKVPPGLEAYAAQFRGKGKGDYYDFLNAILDWVKRKGIASRWSVKTQKPMRHNKADDERLVDIAQAIADSIIRHGVKPHPYFFKQLPKAQADFKKGMKKVVKNALR